MDKKEGTPKTRATGASRRKHLFLFAVWIVLLVSPLASCQQGTSSEPAAAAFHPPDVEGPYTVGVRSLYLVDESRYEAWGKRHRALPLEIWYPSTGSGGRINRMHDMIGELPPEAGPLLEGLYGESFEEFWNLPTSALRDAAVLTPPSPYPVIFFSHGFMGLRYQNFTLAEYLASHGFVVVSVDHYGNCALVNVPGTPLVLFNPFSSVSSYFDRTEDVLFVFNRLQEMNQDKNGVWHGVFDLDRFAVSGHSYGGLTSLLSGVAFDFVKAVAPLNPAWAGDFPPDFSKPIFMLQGENDRFVGSMNEATWNLFQGAASTRKVFINFINGGHYNATDVCVLAPPSIAFLVQGCEPPHIDFHLANRIANAYMTAFFRSVLLEDPRTEGYLMDNHFSDEVELVTFWDETFLKK